VCRHSPARSMIKQNKKKQWLNLLLDCGAAASAATSRAPLQPRKPENNAVTAICYPMQLNDVTKKKAICYPLPQL